MKTACVVVGLAMLCTGCGCGSVPLDDMPAVTAKAVCSKYYECCTAAELMGNMDFGPDQAGCETKVAKNFDGAKIVTAQSEPKGRIKYHGDKVPECLDAYKKLTCEQLKSSATSQIAACDGIFEPKVGADGGCGQDRDCVGGTCVGEGIGVDGLCAPFATEGQGCPSGIGCASGLYCSASNTTCVKQRDDGQACNLNLECKTGGCNGKNPDAGTPGMCGLKGGAGTTCYATQGCSVGGGGLSALALVALLGLKGRRRK